MTLFKKLEYIEVGTHQNRVLLVDFKNPLKKGEERERERVSESGNKSESEREER